MSDAAPSEADLRAAALNHLARYGTTAANLVRVLDRRVARWLRAGGDAEALPGLRAAVRATVARLRDEGLVDDGAFAAARARRLQVAGKSGRATVAHLRARGVAAPLAAEAARLAPEAELAAAAIQLRRRRLGPYAAAAPTPEQRHRWLAVLARAGFGHAVARAALALTRDEAEARIRAFRGGL